MHLLVLLSLWTSKKALPLKIQHIDCQKVKAAYFLCLRSATNVSIPSVEEATLWEEAEVVCSFCSPVKAPVLGLSHIVPELFQCHRLVRGKMQHYPSLLPWLLY